jgi:hypothetical protein
MTLLTQGGQRWEAFMGSTAHPSMTLTGVISSVNIIVEFKPDIMVASPLVEQATLTITACRPKVEWVDSACLVPEGTVMKLTRLF